MRKYFNDKKVVFVIGILSLLMLIFLAASLASLEFKPAVPFSPQTETVTTGAHQTLPQVSLLLIMVIFLILVVVIFLMLPKDKRKHYLSGLIQFLLVAVIAIFIMSRSVTGEAIPVPTEAFGTPVQPIESDPTEVAFPDVTPSAFTPPDVSPWVSFLSALVVLLPVGVGLWWWLARRKKEETPYDELAEIAQSTLDDLEAGKDWGEAVLNCYSRMNKAVEGQRGIRRRGSLTPSEFVAVLERARLPGDALRKLTVLFERVRYGAKQSSQKDIDEAVACLTEIVAACQGAL